jgi:abortive infection bacteriophage resistance protein
MNYSKPALDIARQIAQLEARGLIIPDKGKAEHYLTNISYYRLEGYWWPLQNDKVNHTFKPGSLFDTIIDIYDFDRELRLIVMNMVERIEISLRTRLIYSLSLSQGPWWFENISVFKDTKRWKNHLEALKKDLDRSNEVFIKEHQKKYYTDQRCPPAWKSLEIISFGLLSKLYENLASHILEKDQIAAVLGVANHTYLHSWLQMIAVVRNIAAHHGRLWNRHLSVSPKLLKKAPLPWLGDLPQQRNTVYVALCCMKYLLHTISPDNHFSNRLLKLFQQYPNIDPPAMGFTKNWHTEPLWTLNVEP